MFTDGGRIRVQGRMWNAVCLLSVVQADVDGNLGRKNTFSELSL